MRRMSQFIAAAFLFMPLLVACSKQESEPPAGIPAHLRDIIEANRAVALPPFPDDFRERANAFLTQGLTRQDDLRISRERGHMFYDPRQNIRDVGPGDHLASRIPREDAARDIDFLFELIKYGYAGYQYFGGDDVFLPIRADMLERLERMPQEITGTALLRDILVPGLAPAIADNHFQLHNAVLEPPRLSARMNDDFILRPASEGFVTVIDTVEHRLIEATFLGQRVEGVLPTLTREGEAAYAFGHFARWDHLGPQPLSVLLESAETGERLAFDLRLQIMRNFSSPPVLLHQHEINGVPVAVNRTLMEPYITRDATQKFHEAGASLRGAPAVVLDLRGHGGGESTPMLALIEALSGSRPSSGRAFGEFSLRSNTTGKGGFGVPPVWAAHIGPFAPTLTNESLIVVLADNKMGSAGDRIVSYLRELENVIFVGTNTSGTLVTGDVRRYALPRSGIAVIFGAMLNLRPDFSQFEGVGFMPDLWVQPEESLQRALAFIERYGLNRARD